MIVLLVISWFVITEKVKGIPIFFQDAQAFS
jgi:hypothetical protein